MAAILIDPRFKTVFFSEPQTSQAKHYLQHVIKLDPPVIKNCNTENIELLEASVESEKSDGCLTRCSVKKVVDKKQVPHRISSSHLLEKRSFAI